jgi:DNA-binding beta-propeller fold protein YncE
MAKAPSFRVMEGWERIPPGYKHRDVDGVAIDSKDRVYLMTRGDPRVIVYERDGTFVTSWGEGVFTNRTHGICIGPDDSVYSVDDGDHTVRKFTPDGKQLMILGTSGVPSDSGYDMKVGIPSIVRGAPPFNRPTNAAIAPSGELYVCDGYGNARVHRFAADGKLIQSWGEPGLGAGQFNLPHGIRVMPDGRVMVADRENDRIQIFTPDGKYLDEWTNVQRPTDIYITKDGLVFVSELWWVPGQKSMRMGNVTRDMPGRVSIFDLDGNLMWRWCSADRCAPGNFVAPHCVCVDSHGDMYVGEVTWTFGVSRGAVPDGCHMFQKFQRLG